MLKILKWLPALAAGIWMVGCSEQSAPQPADAGHALRVRISSPIAIQTADQQNITGFDVYLDKQILHAVFTAASGDAKHPFIGYLHSEDGENIGLYRRISANSLICRWNPKPVMMFRSQLPGIICWRCGKLPENCRAWVLW